MKFLALVVLYTTSISVSLAYEGSTVLRRDFSSLLNCLKTCDSDINTVKNDIDTYTGSGTQPLIYRQNFDQVQKDLTQCTNECSSIVASTATASQAGPVVSYCQSPLEPDLKAMLASLKAKRVTFTANGLKPAVQSQLSQLKTNFQGLLNCILSKTPTAQKPAVSSCAAAINADVQDAITYYS